MIDADLQDPPELIPTMLEHWRAGSDVVYAMRTDRSGESRFKLATASWFYRIMSKVSDVPLAQNSGDFRLLDRRALDALLSMRERNRYLRGMTSWVGFTQTAVPYDRDARHAGVTKYPIRKMIRFALDAIASFSHAPLQIATVAGFLFAVARLPRDPGRDRLPDLRGLRPRRDDDRRRRAAARRHPAHGDRHDRRVRRAHLRRGQAAPAVRRARSRERRGRRRG